MNLLENIQICRASSARVILGGTDFNGLPINTQGCDGVLFILPGATDFSIEATTHFLAYVKGSNTSSTQHASTAYSRIGTTAAIMSTSPVAGSRDFRVYAIDVVNPQYKFLKLCVAGATGHLDPLCLKYNLRDPGSTIWRDSTYIGGTTKLIGSTI